ncbi:hypothetical protein EQG49_01890 [Periweissella cryptocerci]|uniref:SHOCT domain-containing protein n=1 Tax=Periweissella cryptocerci TaxID=2506420 RepID=A0A4P6YRQ2_9LACO|nr:hypothetical protein [Periweissella cryptocerci]QBO35301.1 hypothetical protein EQG49_01890 [Periweissella cryptocerci]
MTLFNLNGLNPHGSIHIDPEGNLRDSIMNDDFVQSKTRFENFDALLDFMNLSQEDFVQAVNAENHLYDDTIADITEFPTLRRFVGSAVATYTKTQLQDALSGVKDDLKNTLKDINIPGFPFNMTNQDPETAANYENSTTSELHEDLSGLYDDLEALDDEIAEHEVALADMQTQRESLVEHIEEMRTQLDQRQDESSTDATDADEALTTLRRQFAKGKIDEAEYRRRRDILTEDK